MAKILDGCKLVCMSHASLRGPQPCDLPAGHSGYCLCKKCDSPIHQKRRPVGEIAQTEEAASIWRNWKPMIVGLFGLFISTACLADQMGTEQMTPLLQPWIVSERIIGWAPNDDGVDILGRRTCPAFWESPEPFPGCREGTTIVAFYGQALDSSGHFDGQGNLGRTAQFRITLKEDATPHARGGSGCIDTSAYGSGNPEAGLCVGPDKVISLSEVIGTPRVDERQSSGIYVKKGKLFFLDRDGNTFQIVLRKVRK